MNLKRGKLLVDPPTSASSDIAFILIIFFLVCASVQPGTGREQTIPRSEEEENQSQKSNNIEVSISPGAVVVDGEPIATHRLRRKLEGMLAGKQREEDRVVIVQSSPRTNYQHWVKVTSIIEKAGGIITLQLEKQETISVD